MPTLEHKKGSHLDARGFAHEDRSAVSQSDLARFVGALICAAFGVWLALTVTCFYFPSHELTLSSREVGALPWAVKAWGSQQGYIKDREKLFFLLTLIFGGIGAVLGAWWSLGRTRVTAQCGVILVLYVPVMTLLIGRALYSEGQVAALDSAGGAALLVLCAFLLRLGPGIPWLDRPQEQVTPATARRSRLLDVAAICLPVLLIAEFLVPLNAPAVAASIGNEMHMGFYMIGEATFRFAKGLIPGIDYYTQYSIGTPWLFYYFLAATSAQTMVNAVWFEVGEIALFEVSLFFFLWWFLRSWGWALVVTLMALLLQFTTPDPLYAPSSTASRYPLMMVVAGALVRWVGRDLAFRELLLPAVALACALFLNTETGADACLAVAVAILGTSDNVVRGLWRGALLAVVTFVAFMILNAVAFGPGVFDYRFFEYLAEPMLLFAAGFAAIPIEWYGGWHWLYNIVAPGIAIASIGWSIVVARQPTRSFSREQLAALIFVSLVGVLMSAKFVNMALVTVWQVNSWPFFIVLAWWARSAFDLVGGRPLFRLQWLRPNVLLSIGLLVFVVLFFAKMKDNRAPPYSLAKVSYRTYPSMVNAVFGIKPQPCGGNRPGCFSYPVSAADVALVDRLTQPDERVALLDVEDWAYLVEAKRASHFAMLPSTMTFTYRQLHQAVCGIDLLFVKPEPAATFGIDHADLAKLLVPDLKANFVLVGRGEHLVAWKRAHPRAERSDREPCREH